MRVGRKIAPGGGGGGGGFQRRPGGEEIASAGEGGWGGGEIAPGGWGFQRRSGEKRSRRQGGRRDRRRLGTNRLAFLRILPFLWLQFFLDFPQIVSICLVFIDILFQLWGVQKLVHGWSFLGQGILCNFHIKLDFVQNLFVHGCNFWLQRLY